MLPSFACAISMETRPGQNHGGFGRLFMHELNPNPLAGNFRQFKEPWSFTAEQRKQLFPSLHQSFCPAEKPFRPWLTGVNSVLVSDHIS
jgi:hypothetical protein